MKKIIILLNLTFVLSHLYAQNRTVLFEDQNFKIIHDFYEDKPSQGFYIYPSTSLYYTTELGKNDTFCIAFSKPLGKSYYDGKRFTLLYEYLDGQSFHYCVYEKQEKKWKRAAIHSTSRANFETIINLQQFGMYQIKELIAKDGKERLLELDYDINAKEFTAYKRENERRIKVIRPPFFSLQETNEK